jgi:hypothetical protein
MSQRQYSTEEKLRELRREHATRASVYPNWVRDPKRKFTATMAQQRLDTLQAIIDDYEAFQLRSIAKQGSLFAPISGADK